MSPITPEYVSKFVLWRLEEYGDCMLWKGANNDRGPVVTVDHVQYPLRKVIWRLTHDREIPKGHVCTTSCRERLCLNPNHIVTMTRSELNARTNRTTEKKTRHISIALTKRKQSRLSEEAVIDIRISDERAGDAAAKYGVSAAYVYMLRRNQYRKDFSAPFAGLM